MLLNDNLYQAYLEELDAIEEFRDAHLDLYLDTPIQSEDPYTRRLIEALAFFGAKARLHSVKTVSRVHQVLFRQYFTYMINPLPAFAMVRFNPSIRFPEKIFLEKGKELLFKTRDGKTATFQLIKDVAIFPITLDKARFFPLGEDGKRFYVRFSSPHVVTEELEEMDFYINHLDNFPASLKVAFALQKSLVQAHIIYDDTEDAETAVGEICSTHFGVYPENRTVMNHIFEKVRSALHFPQQELFVRVKLPPAKKKWKTFTICFDLDNQWPHGLQLNTRSLIPFVVPVVNLKKEMADPIRHDGTQDSYSVLHPDPKYQYQLHTVLTVAEVTRDGLKTLQPTFFGGKEKSYEIDYFTKSLLLDIPDAFMDPHVISIEALWTQPWFSNHRSDELEILFADTQSLGLEIHLIGEIEGMQSLPQDDPQFLSRILATKNQSQLSLEEVFFIIKTMKDLDNSYFDFLQKIVKELKTKKYIDPMTLSPIMEYEFSFQDWEGEKAEVVALFFRYVHTVLDHWVSGFKVEVKLILPMSKRNIIIKEGMEYELSVLARDFVLSK